LSQADPRKIQEVAAAQVDLLSKFYLLAINQAERSFTWAIVAAGVGLAFFLTSVALIVFLQRQSAATISLISGSLIEVISAINFYLYGKASTQLAEFHTRLNVTQRFLIANSVCEGLEGDHKQIARHTLVNTIAGSRTDEAPSAP
jgi:hypothetical protein